MYAFRNRRSKNPSLNVGLTVLPGLLLAVGCSFITFGFIFPHIKPVNHSIARVFAEGLDISLDRTSPAFAALEDAWTRPILRSSIAPEGSAIRAISLVAGAISAAPLAETIAAANSREMNLINREKAAREENTRRFAQAASSVFREVASHFSSGDDTATTAGASEPQNALPNVAVADQAADQGTTPIVKQVKTLSLTDLKMSREELVGSLFLPIANSKPRANRQAPSGGHYPSGAFNPDSVPTNVAQYQVPRGGGGRALTYPVRGAHADSASAPPYQALAANSRAMPAHLDVIAPPSRAGDILSNANLHQIMFTGPLELAQGLAVSNATDHLVLRREVDGEMQESGAVWLREGRYEIFAEENTGTLVGELINSNGDVLGRGTVDLATVPIEEGQRRVTGVALQILPFVEGLAGRVLAVRGNNQAGLRGVQLGLVGLPFTGTSGKGGGFMVPGLSEGSLALARVSHPGYWGSLAVVRAGDNNELMAFPNQDGQMIRQLLAMQNQTDLTASISAVVWGRVTSHGQAQAGARVELAGGQQSKAVYFDSTLKPDPLLTETSSNGLYAFFPVAPGVNAVQVVNMDSEAVGDPIVFPGEEKSISRVDLETVNAAETKLKIFNAFKADEAVPARVAVTGSEQTVDIDGGSGVIRHRPGHQLLMVDADGGLGFEHIRAVTARDRHVLYMPMIPSAWYSEMKGRLKFNPEPTLGNIIGFVQSQGPFRVVMDEGSAGADAKVFYFDGKGNLTRGDYGQPGGGYLIFNVPPGFKTVAVQTSGTERIHSMVTLVDPKITNVLVHRFH